MAAELSVAEKLKQLYELQLIDSQINKIEILKGELPVEVEDLSDEIQGLDTRVKRLQNQVKELEQEAIKQQANITEAENLIQRYQRQLDNVKNNREFEALTKELDMQRLEIQLSEKKIRSLKTEIQTREESLSVAEDRMAVKLKELEAKKVELDKIIEKTEKEEQRLRDLSKKVCANIEERLVKGYDKIRHSYRNGLAVVTIERNACGGCFNKITPQLQLEIAQRKKIIACEHCGRILVDDQLVSEVAGVDMQASAMMEIDE